MSNLSPEAMSKIKNIISDMLAECELENFDIEVANDAGGDEAIFVDLDYRFSAQEFDPALITRVRSAVREALLEIGEMRFPYIRHHLPTGQGVKAA